MSIPRLTDEEVAALDAILRSWRLDAGRRPGYHDDLARVRGQLVEILAGAPPDVRLRAALELASAAAAFVPVAA